MAVAEFTIAYDPDFAPITFRDSKGRAAGLCIDPIARALNESGIRHRFLPAELPRMSRILQSGQADAIAGLARTPERAATHDFSPPLLATCGAFFATSTFAGDGVVATPCAGPLAAYLRRHFEWLTIEGVADYRAALEMVLSGKADAAALNCHVGRRLCAKGYPGIFRLPESGFVDVDLALACEKGRNREILDVMTAWLRSSGSGVAPGTGLDSGPANPH